MRKELDKKLCENYPLIFKNRHGDPTQTLMCFGFECNDGWYNIIDILCGLLTSQYNSAKNRYERLMETGAGNVWYGTKIVTQADIDVAKTRMDEEAAKVPVAVQVKEKFGGLRFYVERATDKQYDYITFAESMSYRTCEQCGNTGKLYTNGWHRTLCEHHAKEMGYIDKGENT